MQSQHEMVEMDHPVMKRTCPHQIPQDRAPTPTMIDHMMSIKPAGVMTTRKLTGPMAKRESPPLTLGRRAAAIDNRAIR